MTLTSGHRKRSTVAAFAALALSAAACGGDGEAPVTFTPVSATTDGLHYTLALGAMRVVIDASRGARITELSLLGKNALVTRDENGTYGSTYWPSPQSSWCAAGGACWPPPVRIDNAPYTGGIENTQAITLTSGVATIEGLPGSAVTVSKQFTPVPESGAVDVTYTLTNVAPDGTLTLAPWQVSRVAAGGLTFFGGGSGAVTYAPDNDPTFAVTEAAGDLWYASAPVAHNSKAFADGGGWLAHVTPARLLVVASYPDPPAADVATGEAEIEIFTNGDYVEIESQGALATIGPGQALTWTVRWKLRRLPGDVTVVAGDTALAALAAGTLAE